MLEWGLKSDPVMTGKFPHSRSVNPHHNATGSDPGIQLDAARIACGPTGGERESPYSATGRDPGFLLLRNVQSNPSGNNGNRFRASVNGARQAGGARYPGISLGVVLNSPLVG